MKYKELSPAFIKRMRRVSKEPVIKIGTIKQFNERYSIETRRNISKAEADIRAGRVYTHEQVKKRFGL